LNRPAKLLIADFGATRLGVRMALADQEVEISAEADNATQAIAGAKLAQPDICLVGSELPGGGMAAVRGIQQGAPGAAIVVLGGIGDAGELLTAIRAGAIGYVPGTITREQLRGVFQAVLAGEAVVPPSMVRILIRELHKSAALVDGEVTSRQAQVLDLLRRRHSPAEIARRLEISPVTVRRHMSDLVRKLGLEDRGGLMSFEPGIPVNGDACRVPGATRNNGQVKPQRQA
jgi:DNA-binding NarL/FixJ family response regulator